MCIAIPYKDNKHVQQKQILFSTWTKSWTVCPSNLK